MQLGKQPLLLPIMGQATSGYNFITTEIPLGGFFGFQQSREGK
jgi:hypothetical protein